MYATAGVQLLLENLLQLLQPEAAHRQRARTESGRSLQRLWQGKAVSFSLSLSLSVSLSLSHTLTLPFSLSL